MGEISLWDVLCNIETAQLILSITATTNSVLIKGVDIDQAASPINKIFHDFYLLLQYGVNYTITIAKVSSFRFIFEIMMSSYRDGTLIQNMV